MRPEDVHPIFSLSCSDLEEGYGLAIYLEIDFITGLERIDCHDIPVTMVLCRSYYCIHALPLGLSVIEEVPVSDYK